MVNRRPLPVKYRRRRLLLAVVVGVGLTLGLSALRGQAKPRRAAGPPVPAAKSTTPPPAPAAPLNTRPTVATPSASPPSRPAPASDAFKPVGTVLLKVPVQNQLPELPNGCEVTSLSMLLTAQGTPVSKFVLADEQPTNRTPPVFGGRKGDFYSITRWTNPNVAFVGNVRGYGYGIYHGPLVELLNKKTQGKAFDLSGQRFSVILAQLRTGTPLVLWTTSTFRPPLRWVTWSTTEGPFRATTLEHAVLLVGYTRTKLIINNPLIGRQQQVAPGPFIAAWLQLGRQAVTYR